ncbi:MAG: succinate dehydrogenase [Proteobacteria bacterium]|nr:succinate dehydrogenase [Pseudomonadota bacterium]
MNQPLLTPPVAPSQVRAFLQTRRTDLWWLSPLIVFLALVAFIVYSTWAAFEAQYFFTVGTVGPDGAIPLDKLGVQRLLAPFCSPVLFDPVGVQSGFAWFGEVPASWPSFIPYSPALLILAFPAGFRFTCYYYRGSYYKAFWADPISCAVGEPSLRGKNYRGEQKLPLILQNIHRYFLYVALFYVFLFLWEGIVAMTHYRDTNGTVGFGVSVGTLVLNLNTLLLAAYTLGCHSLRHLVGGGRNQLRRNRIAYARYRLVTWLNERHMLFAWVSLVWVAFADLYVRLCAMGIWTDWRIL